MVQNKTIAEMSIKAEAMMKGSSIVHKLWYLSEPILRYSDKTKIIPTKVAKKPPM